MLYPSIWRTSSVAIAVRPSSNRQREATVRELEHQHQTGERGLHRGANHGRAPTSANAPTGVPGQIWSQSAPKNARRSAGREKWRKDAARGATSEHHRGDERLEREEREQQSDTPTPRNASCAMSLPLPKSCGTRFR